MRSSTTSLLAQLDTTPSPMLALLSYSYATGTFGSRRIEQSTYDNVAVRFMTADTHPDHDTLCPFRRENRALLSGSFVKGLQLAQELKVLNMGQITVSVDGSKVLANGSKHAAVSCERAGKLIEMKAGSGQHFEQSFNAQAAVEVDSRLIVGPRVSQAPNDQQELVPTVNRRPNRSPRRRGPA